MMAQPVGDNSRLSCYELRLRWLAREPVTIPHSRELEILLLCVLFSLFPLPLDSPLCYTGLRKNA